MRSKKSTFITFVIAVNILSSCVSPVINTFDGAEPKVRIIDDEIERYFTYQHYDKDSINSLELYIKNSSLSGNKLNKLKQLHRNLKKIASEDSFTIKLHGASNHSFELIELAYDLNLSINIEWIKSDVAVTPLDLGLKEGLNFCSSVYEDAFKSITNFISSNEDSTLIIYMEKYSNLEKRIVKKFPGIDSVLFEGNDPQKFSAKILGIDSSNIRFNKIADLNPNQTLAFAPRPRDDIKNILLILEPEKYQSILPAFKYHGGEKFQYINFISSLEKISTVNQLLDFEDTFTPISLNLSQKIQRKEIFSLENILQRSSISDWLTVEILKQANIKSAEISGMTGNILFQKNSCAQRDIPMQMIHSKWVSA